MKKKRSRSKSRPVLAGIIVILLVVVLAGLGKVFLLDNSSVMAAFTRQAAKTPAQIPAQAKPEDSVPKDVPQVKASEWNLYLVNSENLLPKDYHPEVRSLPNGLQFDARAYDSLLAMLNDGQKEGLSFVVCSAYRSAELQQSLFDAQVAKQRKKGLSQAEAEKVAKTIVAYPGTSEHQLGLAADIVALDYQTLDDGYANTPEAKWLKEHAHEYGFILRYPADKEAITKIVYEPWHFRYVGREHAQEIKRLNICLEEYLEHRAGK